METNERIIRAAQKLFARFGYNKTTVDEIAAGAQIAKTTLYHHFKGKEAVFRAVIEFEGRELGERIADAVAAAPSPEEKLRSYSVARMRHLKNLGNFYTALRAEYLEHYAFIEAVREQDYQDEIKILREILEQGVLEGSFKLPVGDIGVTAMAILTALRGLEYPWTDAADVPEITEHVEALLRVLFHGLLAE